jgi:hypothetical protein
MESEEEESQEEEEEESEGEEGETTGQEKYSGKLKVAQNAIVKNRARAKEGGRVVSKFCTECGEVISHTHKLSTAPDFNSLLHICAYS